MPWRCSGDKPLFEPMMVRSLMHICVTRPQWVNGRILSTTSTNMNIRLHFTWLFPIRRFLITWADVADSRCVDTYWLCILGYHWLEFPSNLTHWGLVTTYGIGDLALVNIGSGNDLVPDGTKPLPEPMLTDHQWIQVTFIVGQQEMPLPSITKICLKITCLKFH